MNRELVNIFNQNQGIQNFNSLKITIASPEDIRSWSFGEIKKPEPSIIELLNQRKMDFSVQEFLDQ